MDASLSSPPAKHRIEAIDVARGVALLAMASFHFTWDLEFFGYIEGATTAHGLPRLYARAIASTFLFLVGVSLFLAHGGGVRRRVFARRLAMVAGAAGLITLGTFLAMRDEFIFFGILHEIALASLLGLAFLRLPALVTLLAAGFVIAAPHALRSAVFNQPGLWWVGLSTVNPRSNDYVPLFPWFGAVLLGIAMAKIAGHGKVLAAMARWTGPAPARPLAFLGRHSLVFYLLHQPVLLGLLWLLALAAPPTPETPQVQFMHSCEPGCVAVRGEDFCARYCACMLDNIEAGGMMSSVLGGNADEQTKAGVEGYASLCTGSAEDGAKLTAP